MVSAAVLLLGLAVVVWPSPCAARRLSALAGAPTRRSGRCRLRPTTTLVVVGLGSVGWLLAGVAGAVAGPLVGATGWRTWRDGRRLRRTLAAAEGLAEALRSFVGELRAGAHPATAAESAAEDAEGHAAIVMRTVSATARLGGDVESALRTGVRTPELAGVLADLGRAWALVLRHGLPLADVLDAVVRDLDERVRFARHVHARMAGPRASATVLALLPVVGILLGEAMGAHPTRVLTGTSAGQLLLVLGTTLVCAGVAWSARLTGRAVLPS